MPYRTPTPDHPITYNCAHDRAVRQWGPASGHPCAHCRQTARDWAYDGTDPTEIEGTDGHGRVLRWSIYPEFYMPLCRRCHRQFDLGYPSCRVSGCYRKHKAKGLCDTHAKRARAGRSLSAPVRRRGANV